MTAVIERAPTETPESPPIVTEEIEPATRMIATMRRVADWLHRRADRSEEGVYKRLYTQELNGIRDENPSKYGRLLHADTVSPDPVTREIAGKMLEKEQNQRAKAFLREMGRRTTEGASVMTAYEATTNARIAQMEADDRQAAVGSAREELAAIATEPTLATSPEAPEPLLSESEEQQAVTNAILATDKDDSFFANYRTRQKAKEAAWQRGEKTEERPSLTERIKNRFTRTPKAETNPADEDSNDPRANYHIAEAEADGFFDTFQHDRSAKDAAWQEARAAEEKVKQQKEQKKAAAAQAKASKPTQRTWFAHPNRKKKPAQRKLTSQGYFGSE